MTDARSERIEQLFASAQQLAPEERAAYLERECGGDPALQAKVEDLLAAADGAEDYFNRLADRLGVAAFLQSESSGGDGDADDGATGRQVGAYTLTGRIGAGGMGSVWSAERSDGRFEGRVAIKLLNLERSGAAARRFEMEGGYLAKLTHPNIARLLDAGLATDSRPYLVIELVDGVAIDRYCDERQLEVPARIRLFLDVLAAVAHAHANLIVHRDIKPSNVLVTTDGLVKLLDFGVAKLLRGDGDAAVGGVTREIGLALTPEYAAPEQLLGGSVTTATDVYSLGLLLCKLLAGRHARSGTGDDAQRALQAITESESPKLSDIVIDLRTVAPEEATAVALRRRATPGGLRKLLRGDLDNIVRKALEFEPASRYGTVADFAADLRRYLRHEPVSAQPATVAYRVGKFVRRHRGGVLVASLALIAIVATAAIATWQGVEAQRQRDLALYQQQRTQATNQFMNLLLSEIGPQGAPLTPVELLDRGVGMLDRQYGIEPRFLAPMFYELANGYFSLGRSDRLLELLGRAEQAARRQGDYDLLAAALCTQARVDLRTEPDASRRKIQEAHAALGRVKNPSIDSFSSCARADALLLELDGDRQSAIEEMEKTLREVESNPVATISDRLQVSNELARLYYNARELGKALRLNDSTLELMRSAGLGESSGYLVNAMNGTVILATLGEIRSASEQQQALLERVSELDPASRPVGLASAYGTSLTRLARFDEALAIYEEQRDVARSMGNSYVEAESEMHLGRIKMLMQRYAEAQAHLDTAERELMKAPQSNARLLEALAIFRARTLLGQGDVASARLLVASALERLGYPQSKDAPGLHHVLRVAAEIALETGDAAAERYATDSVDAAISIARAPEASADVGQALVLRARARERRGDQAGATSDLTAAIASLTNGFGADHPDTREARNLLSRVGT